MPPQQRNAVQRLIDHIVRAVKGLFAIKQIQCNLDEFDVSLKRLNARYFVYGRKNGGEIAAYGGDNNNRPKFSKTEQSSLTKLPKLTR